MSREELIKRLRECIYTTSNFGMDPQSKAEEFVDECIKLCKEEIKNNSLEDYVCEIKNLAKKKGLDVDVTLKYN